MDGNVDIYCEFGFLEKFCDSCPQIENGIPSMNYQNWLKYFNLLCGKSDVVLTDIAENEYNNSTFASSLTC